MNPFFTRLSLPAAAAALLAITSPISSVAQVNGEYRSDSATGIWANAAIWSVYNSATSTWSQATSAPSGASAIVTVRNGHTVQISGNISFKRLTINSGGTVVADGSGEKRMDFAADTSMIVNNGTLGAFSTAGPEKLGIATTPATKLATITGTGSSSVARIRFNTSSSTVAQTSTLVIDQDLNITSSGITAYYNNASNTNAENCTITINAGKTVTMSGALHSSSATISNAGGSYTYNINGTLDMSTTSTISYFLPINNASSVVTVNVGGTWKVGNLNLAYTGSNTGAVKINVLNGGLIDLSRAATFTPGSKFFVLSGSGRVRRAVPTTAATTLFPIGTADGIYNPLTIAAGPAHDTFTVGVRNALSYSIGDPSKIVTKQWEIIPNGTGAGFAPTFGWHSSDQAAGFTTAGPMRLFRYNPGPPTGYAPVSVITTVTGSGSVSAPFTASPATTPATLNGLYVVGDSEAAIVVIPSVTISANPGATACAGVPVKFSATTTNITGPHFQWKVNGTNRGSDSVQYTTTGLLNGDIVTCEISYVANGTPADTSNPITMTILPQPSAGTITGPGTVCSGTSGSLASTVSGGTWSSSNNTVASVSATGTVNGLTVGSVIISYSVTNTCGSATTTQAVAVTLGASAGTISGTSTICAGATAALSSTAPGGVWYTGNSSVATVSAAGVVSGSSAGAAVITYVVVNGCGTDTARQTVTVNPAASAGLITGPSVVCRGTTITLSSNVSGGTWTSSGPLATVSSAGVVSGVNPGTVVISYTVTTTCGTAVARDTIVVGTAPVLSAITGPSTVCPGASITLADSVAGGIWNADNGNVSVTAGGVVTGNVTGVSVVSYTLSNACGTAVVTKTVTIGALPVTATITARDTICVNASFTASASEPGGIWTSARKRVGVATDGLVMGIQQGEDTLVYSVTNACGTARSYYPVFVSNCFPTTVPAAGNPNAALIFPNPNNGQFNFQWNANVSEPVEIRITDMFGALVATYKTHTNRVLPIVINAAPGMYLLTASTSHSQQRMKVNTAR